jgi:hypothetical protein
MWMWIYCLLATAYFIHYKDYLFFMRDTIYRNMIWSSDSPLSLDMDVINEYLTNNYSLIERIISKIFFVFISPIYFLYVLFYVINRLDY